MEAINYLRSKDTHAQPNTFDGRVAAMVPLRGEEYLITTNTTYVPATPSLSVPHKVCVRADMRFGTDDPSLWPQQFSHLYPHLPLTRRKDFSAGLGIMWWNPTRQDFVVTSSITRGLGRLSPARLTSLLHVINPLIKRCRNWMKTQTKDAPVMGRLLQSITLVLERLESLPSTFDKMVYEVTTVQRNCLELDALLEYYTVYRPQQKTFAMDAVRWDHSVAMDRLGAFTSTPAIAQLLFDASIPFWFLRPTFAFTLEDVKQMVELTEPFAIEMEPAPGSTVLYMNDTDSKLDAIFQAGVEFHWYHDPFNLSNSVPTAGLAPASAPATSSSALTLAGPSNVGRNGGGHSVEGANCRTEGKGSRGGPPKPYAAPRRHASARPPKTERNKYVLFQGPGMPDALYAWAEALKIMDRTSPGRERQAADTHYIMPEPALLVSAQAEERRNMFVRHWVLIKDVFEYRAARGGAIGRAACVQEPLAYTDEEMSDLEWAVACYYTQSFYEYFGRAVVVPMCLKNDWSKFSNWPQST
ncbi:hypothetical protein DFH09DRAFT_1304498 [Mycena vulgaris]|nr:hypothetical protein DFH09DRAFT_1304498 [Mycena vulgaris]